MSTGAGEAAPQKRSALAGPVVNNPLELGSIQQPG